MHIFNDAQRRVQEFVTENSTTLLTAGGVVGTVATAVLAGRAGFKAQQVIAERELISSINKAHTEMEAGEQPEMNDVKLSKTEKFKLTVVYFIPPVVTGATTIVSIIMAHRMSAQKAAALAAVYGLSQKQLEEYKAKVAEKLTGTKNQQVTDELAQDDVDKNPPPSNLVVISGDDVLCFDRPTGRYFKSSMEKINQAVMATNQEIINHGYCPASFFYSELELEDTTWADNVGFNLENMVELDITTTQTSDGRPCLAINFKKFPVEDFLRHRDAYL